MKFLLIIICVCFCSCSCEEEQKPSKYEIMSWGDIAYKNIHRASCIVAGANITGSCVAISPKHILTAAHVVVSSPENTYVVFSYRADKKEEIDCDFVGYKDLPCLNSAIKIDYHPDYVRGKFRNDLAIITLKWDLSHYSNLFERPFYPPEEWGYPEPGETVTSFGYGLSDDGDNSLRLRIGPNIIGNYIGYGISISGEREIRSGDSGGGSINDNDQLVALFSHKSNIGDDIILNIAMVPILHRKWAQSVIGR
jgi:hypothetical protein